MSRKKTPVIQDPYADREAQKYEHPIPSREFILEILKTSGKPQLFEWIAKQLTITSDEQIIGLQRRLRAMERDGQIICNRRNKYCLVKKVDLLPGVVLAQNDGFGFVELDRGGDDLFLSPQQMHGLFDGDRVLVREVQLPGRRPHGIVIEVTERSVRYVAGRLINQNNIWFVIPESKRINRDIVVDPKALASAIAGQMVVVELLLPQGMEQRREPTAKVIEILGEPLDPGMETDIAIRTYNLPYVWRDEVLNEAQQFSETVDISDIGSNRKDCRDLAFVTIDGADARDFDDAVYAESLPRGGFKLFVAIADVSHYVKVDSALDQDAYERGNSVYFPKRVIPMLPEVLSNEWCSLKPQVDRLAMICEVMITKTGKISSYEFYEALIHSRARLTYDQVAVFLTGRIAKAFKPIEQHIQNLNSLFRLLLAQREKRGAIDFDFPETKIIFNEQLKIDKIVPSVRNDAHRLIEECMLVANVCAAEFLEKSKTPALYRVHAAPEDERLKDLRAVLGESGLRLGGGGLIQNPKISIK